MQVNPYVHFKGTCEAAFKFYEQVLGTKVEMMMTHGESPMAEHVAPEWRSKILHATMNIGNTALMGSDAPPPHYQQPQGFSVSLEITDPAQAEKIFAALSVNGKISMPMEETFWATRFGMLVDQFGIPWLVNCSKTQ